MALKTMKTTGSTSRQQARAHGLRVSAHVTLTCASSLRCRTCFHRGHRGTPENPIRLSPMAQVSRPSANGRALAVVAQAQAHTEKAALGKRESNSIRLSSPYFCITGPHRHRGMRYLLDVGACAPLVAGAATRRQALAVGASTAALLSAPKIALAAKGVL